MLYPEGVAPEEGLRVRSAAALDARYLGGSHGDSSWFYGSVVVEDLAASRASPARFHSLRR